MKITLGNYVKKRCHFVFLRESDLEAWGATITVKAGSMFRRYRDGEWSWCHEDRCLWMEAEDSHLEVFNAIEGVIDIYDAYGN